MERNTRLLQEYNNNPSNASITSNGEVDLTSYPTVSIKNRRSSGSVPFFNEPVGDLFDEAGGVKKIDEKLSYYDLNDIPEARAQAQSVGDRLGKILPRITTKILEETAKLPGELFGMAEWLSEGTDLAKFAETVNNEWVKGVTEISEAVKEDILPIYTPRSVQNGNLWDNITSSSFWATEGADGIGFLAAMMLPGQFLKAAKFGQGIAKLGKSAKMLAEGDVYLAKTAKAINAYSSVAVNTAFESISEGLESVKGAERVLYDKKVDELVKSGLYDPQEAADLAAEYIKTPEAKKITGQAGFDTFKANLPILLLSNALDQKWLWGGFGGNKALSEAGQVVNDRLGKSVGSMSGDFLGDVTRLTGKEKALRTAKGLGAGVLKEGFLEEGLQFSASKYYQDKAVNQKSGNLIEDVQGTLDMYFDSLTDVDMQKSIFLGAAMGGGMGMIGASNQAKTEDRMLFGDSHRDPNKVEKLLGMSGRQERIGLVNLLKENYNSHFDKVSDLYTRDKEGKVIYDTKEDGTLTPKLDHTKVLAAAQSKMSKSEKKEELIKAIETGDQETFDFVKNQMDFEYMLPYLQEEGGYELLKSHISRMAIEDKERYEKLGVETPEIDEMKKDLLGKLEIYKKLYDGVQKTVVNRLGTPKDKYSRAFDSNLEQYMLSLEVQKDYLNKRSKLYKDLLNKTLTDDQMSNVRPVKAIQQIVANKVLNINGVKKVVVSRKDNVVRLHEVGGKIEEIPIDQLMASNPEIFFSLRDETVQTMFTVSEMLEGFQNDLEKISEQVDKMNTREGQEEMYKELFAHIKEQEKAVKESTEKEVTKAVKKAKTPEEVEKIKKDVGKEAEKTVDKVVKKQAVNEVINFYAEQFKFYEEEDGARKQKEDEFSIDNSVINGDEVGKNDKKLTLSQGGKAGSSGEYLVNLNVFYKKIEGKETYSHEFQYDVNGDPVKSILDNKLQKELNKGLQAIADGKLHDKDGNLRKDIPIRFEVDINTDYNTGITLGRIPNNDNFQVQVWINVNGEDILLGFLPNYKESAHMSQQLMTLRDNIWRETKGLIKSVKQSNWTTTLNEVLPGQIKRTNKMSSPSKVANKRPYHLSVVVSKGEGLFQHETLPDKFVDVLNARHTSLLANPDQKGHIYMWMEHPVLKGRWFSLRVFTKELAELPELKQQVIDLLKTVKDEQTYISVRDEIRTNLAWIDFKYRDGLIIPVEVKGGEKVEKPDMAMKPEDVGTKFPNWLNTAGAQINKTNLNKIEPDNPMFDSGRGISNMSTYVEDRLRINVDPNEPFFLMNATVDLSSVQTRDNKVTPAQGTKVESEPIVKEQIVEQEQSKIQEDEKETSEETSQTNNEEGLLNERDMMEATPNVSSEALDNIDLDDLDGDVLISESEKIIDDDIENKIIDIERRRKEELKTNKLPPLDLSTLQGKKNEDSRKTNKALEIFNSKNKEINTKYDLELEKLNQSKTRIADEQQYELWNEQEESEWYATNFSPDIPLKALEGLKEATKYGKRLWGLYKAGIIYIAKDAAKGTVYHEAFHVIFNMHLTELQKKSLLKNHTEEELADHFMEYVMTEMEDKSLGNRINSFFKYLWAVIKRIATGNIDIDEIFYKANHGGYKNAPFSKPISELKADQSERPRTRFTARKEREIATSYNNYILNNVIPSIKNARVEGNLVHPEYQEFTDAQILKAEGVGKIYKVIYGSLLKTYAAQTDPVKKAVIKAQLDEFANYDIVDRKPIFKGFRDLYDIAIRDLANYDIIITGNKSNPNSQKVSEQSFEEDSEDTYNLDSIEEQDGVTVDSQDIGKQESYATTNQEKSTKIRTPYLIKKYIRNLSRLDKNGKKIYNDAGMFVLPIKYDEFYDTLMKDVSSGQSVAEMIEILNDLSQFTPEYKIIANTMEVDHTFATAFFSTFNKPMQLQLFLSESNEGDFIVSEANRKTIKKIIIEDWATGVIESGVINDDNKIDVERVKTMLALIVKYHARVADFNEKDSIDLATELNEFGMFIKPEVFNYLRNQKKLSSAFTELTLIINALKGTDAIGKKPAVAPSNVFDPNVGDKENRAINSLANLVKKADTSLSESAHSNTNNKIVYAHLEGNYIVRKIIRMSESEEAFNREIAEMSKDPVIASFLGGFKWNENMRFSILDGLRYLNQFNGVDYTKMTAVDLNVTILNLFRNNGSKTDGVYRMFTLSDSPTMALMQYSKIHAVSKAGIVSMDDNSKITIARKLRRVATGELQRIQRLQSRNNAFINNLLNSKYKVTNYDSSENLSLRTGFKMLPFLNGKIKELPEGNLTEDQWITFAEKHGVEKLIIEELDRQSKNYLKELISQEILTRDEKTKKLSIVKGRLSASIATQYNSIEDFVDDFIYNDYYVRTQLVTIGMGDIAFYAKDKKGNNNTVDPQKRSKEIVSPKMLLDTSAYYEIKDKNGVVTETVYTGTKYKSFYSNDQEFYSPIGKDVFEALIKGNENDPSIRRQAIVIASKYGYSNFSFENNDKKLVRIAVDNADVASVEYSKEGPVFKDKDGKVIENVTYFISKKINQTDGQAYITMDFYRRTMIGAERWNPRLQNAYDRIMKKEGTVGDIELVTESFTSIKPFMYTQKNEVQNGETIRIPVQHKNSEYVLIPQLVEQADEKLQKIYSLMTNPENPIDIMNFSSAVKVGNFASEDVETVTDPVVHEFDMTDRGIQQEVPEHYLDSEGNFGTQIRKHIMAGLKRFNKQGVEIEVLYKLHGKDKSPDQIYNLYNDLITENLLENFRYLEKELYTIVKDKDGNITSKTVNIQRVKDILLSEIQSRNKGLEYEKAIELVTRNDKLDFALPLSHPSHARSVENLLNAIFKNRVTKQKINGGSFVQVSNFGFTDKLKVVINKETGSIEYLEVMLPWWSKDKFSRYVTNGEVDIAKIEAEEPELLKGIGYRIPTEDKYSMVPLKIVGFLPQEAGGVVMLPAEITTIAGSDFDIDKLYIMLKQYEKVTDLSLHPSFSKTLEEEYQVHKQNIITTKDVKNWDEKRGRIEFASSKDVFWDDEQKKFFYKKTIKNAEGKEIENPVTKRLRVYQYNDSKSVGENNRAKRDNEIIDIMFSVLTNPNTLKDFINPGGSDTLSTLAERLDKVYGSKTDKDFMSVQTQNEFAIANMVGKSLVGVAANHTANYSIRLHTTLTLKSPVLFNGERLTSIHGQVDYKGNSIGKNIAEPLAAIVDNAKNPIAAAIFYNDYTADIISLIIASGATQDDAYAFINQPVLRKFIEEAIKTDLGKQKELLKQFAKKYNLDPLKAEAENIGTDQLWNAIEDQTDKSIEQKVVASFLQYKRQAEDLGTFIRATRGDTTGGAAGPTGADTEIKLRSIEKALQMKEITGIEKVLPTKPIKGTNRIELIPEESSVKWLVTFIQKGIIEADKFQAEFFPYSKPGFKAIKDEIELFKGRPLTAREINLVNSHIMTYSLSGHSFYNMTKEEREKFIYEFPSEFAAMKKFAEYGEYLTKQNGMTMRLKLEKKNIKIGKDFQNIDYDNTNSFSNNQIEDIKADFLDLFESEDPKLKKLALDLVKYAFVVSGFNFGPNSFFQMIPTEFYTDILPNLQRDQLEKQGLSEIEISSRLDASSLNNYIDNIMMETEADNIYKKEFLNQFYRNMWKRSAFVSLVDTTEEGSPKDFTVQVAKDGTIALQFKVVDGAKSNLEKYQEGKQGEAKKMKPFLLFKGKRDILVIWNDKTQTYIETHKLGVPNYVVEYSKNNLSLSSALKGNNTDKVVPTGNGTKIVPTTDKTIPKVESTDAGTTPLNELFSVPKTETKQSIDENKGREYTPENVISLKSNEVFVFGSNAEGVHGKGAALTAKQKFSAKQGQAEGLQGQSYAIITKKNWRVEKSSTLQEIGKGIMDFTIFASSNKDKKFYVTKLGSSLAGYTITEIKNIFKSINDDPRLGISDNIILPKEYEVRDQTESSKGRTVEIVKDNVSNFKVTVMQDGRVFNTNTGKLLDKEKDARLINKGKLKSGYYQYTKVKATNGTEYAVVQHETEGTKVISLATSNMGGELSLTSSIAQEVLSKAPSREQTLAKQVADRNLTDNLDKTEKMYYLAEEEARKLIENMDPRIVDETNKNEEYCKQ